MYDINNEVLNSAVIKHTWKRLKIECEKFVVQLAMDQNFKRRFGFDDMQRKGQIERLHPKDFEVLMMNGLAS